ncbi:oxidoreductase [Skermanella stibiiresistens SB22]|uniref:Oxidoreductase n=1 Tax=Skermanella stibiiresistens SB22 TaxID=1385369 RepID=W9HF44_9PROT|nr:Gfo/Idh/MocA family oxidoreductase [Skermanella stibiiresistens]EWY42523.1 oxidoreductase [Skermanella stibiiresistens SB22]
MRIIVVGLGNQGRKRLKVAGADAVGTVDPVAPDADWRRIEDVPPDCFDAALVCTPDGPKLELLARLLGHGKHVLVEKPLFASAGGLARLDALARANAAVCYTAYNHRFEPHFERMAGLIRSGELGRVYRCRLSYGNGTARDVRDSVWRDQGAGVLPDLGSHLLDTLLFWFGDLDAPFRIWSASRFENRAFDHVVAGARGMIVFEIEMSLLNWRNQFTCDILAENGSAHIDSLCKWGPSVFTRRHRVLPSGRPPEDAITVVRSDPTWTLEYAHFKRLCETGGPGNMGNDRVINAILDDLAVQALEGHGT